MTVYAERFWGHPHEWDSFVRAQDNWTNFHLHGWRSVIERVHGHDCPYLCARDEQGLLAGVLPLVRVESPVFGRFLVSMPFVNYGGPLGSPAAIAALLVEATRLADADHADLLELRSTAEIETDFPVSHRKITVLLDLPDSADALRQAIGAKLRSQIKRPEKEGVTIQFGPDQVEPFFEVFSRHMRDLGTPTQSLSFFAEIARQFGAEAWFGCAWLHDVPIAAGAGFRWRDEFEMTWASSLREHNRIAPNMLLYWEFMARAIDEGLKLFNFGRCSVDGGTHRFKRQWGSRDAPLFWYQRSTDGIGATPSPDDARYALGPRVWRHLPLAIANTLGPQIVKFIP